MMPVTASLQWHFMPMSPLDVYIGGGAGWVRFSDLKGSSDLADLDIDRVRFKSRTAAMAQAGLTLGSWRGLGLNVDAKYIDAKTKSTATFTDGSKSTERELKVAPWLWSAGLRWRF
jgi:outer membrane protein W